MMGHLLAPTWCDERRTEYDLGEGKESGKTKKFYRKTVRRRHTFYMMQPAMTRQPKTWPNLKTHLRVRFFSPVTGACDP